MMNNFPNFRRIRRLQVLLVILGLLIVLYLLTYSSANILTFRLLLVTIWPQHSLTQTRSETYYLLQLHSNNKSNFKKKGDTITRRRLQEEQHSKTNYLRHFRSVFILETPSDEVMLDRKENAHRISEKGTDSRPSAANNKLIVMNKMPEWMTRKFNAKLFDHCPVSTCSLSTNYDADRAAANAVVFHDAPTDMPVPPRASADQVYVFHMLEPPTKTGSTYRDTPWNSAFNWTWSYRHDADIRTTYFSLEHSKQLPNISFLIDLVRKKEKPAAWFVSNCNYERISYVERLKKVLPVDIYGACGTLHCTTWARECETLLSNYFFYLSFENSYCQDYVTEKFSRAFLKDVYVVPVARGGLNYSHHFPEGIYINADKFSSPEDLGMYLIKLMNDEKTYTDMLWRIGHFIDFYKDPYYYSWCQLCDKLHRLQDNAKTYPDLFEWYHNGKCRPPREF